MRKVLGLSLLALTLGSVGLIVACGNDDSTFDNDGGTSGTSGTSGASGASGGTSGGNCGFGGCTDANNTGQPQCFGLACDVDKCEGQPTKTTLTGKVYDPAGNTPLFNVLVYVADPDIPLANIELGLGPACDRCDGKTNGILTLSDFPEKGKETRVFTLTDAKGDFTLPNVPSGKELTLVMQIGKWRRVVKIPAVTKCQATALTDKNVTRLPRNHGEGDIPRIAIATGGADPMECLFRKIGLDTTEFGVLGNNDTRVHLYEGASTDSDPDQIATSKLKNNTIFDKATNLWNDANKLKAYDIVVLGCEGGEHPEQKSEQSRRALYDYAKVGGRIFTSHYHHYWFSNSPFPEVKGLASWTNDFSSASTILVPEPSPAVTVQAAINTTFPKGAKMKEWLGNVGALTEPGGTLAIQEMRHNVEAPTDKLLSWMTVQNPATGANNRVAHEYVTFNTPVGVPDDQVCGRVVYSDLHVVPSAQPNGDKAGVPFPDGCIDAPLTPQQKALEFMLFDLSSCIQNDKIEPTGPR